VCIPPFKYDRFENNCWNKETNELDKPRCDVNKDEITGICIDNKPKRCEGEGCPKTLELPRYIKEDIQIPQEKKVAFFMIKLPNHAYEFEDVTQRHYPPKDITTSVIEEKYFFGEKSVNKYFYESSNENVALRGTIIDWITYDKELTSEQVAENKDYIIEYATD